MQQVMGNGVSQALWLESQFLLRAAGNWLWPATHNITPSVDDKEVSENSRRRLNCVPTARITVVFLVVTFVVVLEC